MGNSGILGILTLTTILSMIPIFVICLTAFTKFAVVLFIVRNAVGLQQTPPNVVLYGIALILAFFVSAPTLGYAYEAAKAAAPDLTSLTALEAAFKAGSAPFVQFLSKHSEQSQVQFFLQATTKVWGAEVPAARPDDMAILVPAFMASELTRAFTAGFVLYLPFLAIDLVVTSVLMAMGMQMMSPSVISVPFKLLLFVLVDGWARLFHGLVLSYGVG